MAATLKSLLARAHNGEFLGQDDGNIFRVHPLTDYFNVSEERIESAVQEVGGVVVAGVVLTTPIPTPSN